MARYDRKDLSNNDTVHMKSCTRPLTI